MEDRKLRFGVIGAGDFAKVCHVPGISSHPGAEVVAICGRDDARTRAAADELGVRDVYTDYRDLCARDDVDGVTVATPNACHAEQAMAALKAGKHVFCEKPMATTLEDAREMFRRAEQSGKVHRVAFTFRYLYGVRELKNRIARGEIGEPYFARVQYDAWTGLDPAWRAGWQQRRATAGGGFLYELGSHLFDTLRFVLGPFRAITGFLHTVPRTGTDRGGSPLVVENDDLAAASIVHRSGARSQWFISRVTPPYVANGYLEVIGPEGALRAALSRGSVDSLGISRPSKPEWEDLTLPPEASSGTPHCLNRMMRGFVDACIMNGLDGNGDATFHDGLAVQEALDAVEQADRRVAWMEGFAEC